MKKLSHDEWQAIVKKEADLLNAYLNGATRTSDHYSNSMKELEEIKKGGTACLGCTLGRSLPH